MPSYWLSIGCPSCGAELDVQFVEIGRYEFAPIVPLSCPECGYANRQELERMALDANDVAAEKQHMERLADA